MPRTAVHDTACGIAGTALVATGIYLGLPKVVLMGVGAFLGLLFSPDLDWDAWLVLNAHTGRQYLVSDRRKPAAHELKQRRVFGRVQRRWPKPFRQWWGVYALAFGHRGGSHWLFFGTFSRLAWLAFIPMVLAALFPTVIVPILFGITGADTIHIVLDKIF